MLKKAKIWKSKAISVKKSLIPRPSLYQHDDFSHRRTWSKSFNKLSINGSLNHRKKSQHIVKNSDFVHKINHEFSIHSLIHVAEFSVQYYPPPFYAISTGVRVQKINKFFVRQIIYSEYLIVDRLIPVRAIIHSFIWNYFGIVH